MTTETASTKIALHSTFKQATLNDGSKPLQPAVSTWKRDVPPTAVMSRWFWYHRSFETAENTAKQWRQRGMEVEIRPARALASGQNKPQTLLLRYLPSLRWR